MEEYDELTLWDRIKSVFKTTKENICPEFTAKRACLVTLYGDAVINDNKRLNKFYQVLNEIIQYKCSINDFTCTCKIPEDLVQHKEEIINSIKNRGFDCFILNDKIKLKDLTLFVSWKSKY